VTVLPHLWLHRGQDGHAVSVMKKWIIFAVRRGVIHTDGLLRQLDNNFTQGSRMA